jgi:hypothetical protein
MELPSVLQCYTVSHSTTETVHPAECYGSTGFYRFSFHNRDTSSSYMTNSSTLSNNDMMHPGTLSLMMCEGGLGSTHCYTLPPGFLLVCPSM